jgi:hypothetical protein
MMALKKVRVLARGSIRRHSSEKPSLHSFEQIKCCPDIFGGDDHDTTGSRKANHFANERPRIEYMLNNLEGGHDVGRALFGAKVPTDANIQPLRATELDGARTNLAPSNVKPTIGKRRKQRSMSATNLRNDPIGGRCEPPPETLHQRNLIAWIVPDVLFPMRLRAQRMLFVVILRIIIREFGLRGLRLCRDEPALVTAHLGEMKPIGLPRFNGEWM